MEWMRCKGFSFEIIVCGHPVYKGFQEASALYKVRSWRCRDIF